MRRRKQRRLDRKSNERVSSETSVVERQVSLEILDSFDRLSLELLVKILFYLPIRSVMCMELMNRKLQEAVSMHLRIRKSFDFTEEGWYEYMPDGFTDHTFKKFLQRMPVLEYVYGLNPRKLSHRWTRGNEMGFSIPGIVDALQSCENLLGIETCHVQLLEAVLTYIDLIEIMGKFANRNGTFPPDPHNRLCIPKLSRIKVLHLTGVTMPELPQIVTLEEIIIEWVKLTNAQPFKDFGSRRLHTFVMRNCAGPTNALKYVPLVAGLAASHRLQRLELIRVPFLGGLFQHVIEDAWRMEGFGKLKKILIGTCKNCLEIDLGYLVVCSEKWLEELTIQPSLSKDSFFSALRLADTDFPQLKSLNLGYVHPFPEAEGYTNEKLVQYGLADVTENPALLTDNGMKAAGEVFPTLRALSAYNCPHLHKPHLWMPTTPGNLTWSNLATLHLNRCHAIKLDSFCKFVNQLDSIVDLYLEQMFREQPMGCSRVGLSAGTGIGVSSALVTNNNGNNDGDGDNGNDDGDQQQGNQEGEQEQQQQQQQEQQPQQEQQQAQEGGQQNNQQQQNQPQPQEEQQQQGDAAEASPSDQKHAGDADTVSVDKTVSDGPSTSTANDSQVAGPSRHDGDTVKEKDESGNSEEKMDVDESIPSSEKPGEEDVVAMETNDVGAEKEEKPVLESKRANRSSQSSPDALQDTSNQSCQASSQQIEEETSAAAKAAKDKVKKETTEGEETSNDAEEKTENEDVVMETDEPNNEKEVDKGKDIKDTKEQKSGIDKEGKKEGDSQEKKQGESVAENDPNAMEEKEMTKSISEGKSENHVKEKVSDNVCDERTKTSGSTSIVDPDKPAGKSGNRKDSESGKRLPESGNKKVDASAGESGKTETSPVFGKGKKLAGKAPRGKTRKTDQKPDFSNSEPSTSKASTGDSVPSTSKDKPMETLDSQKSGVREGVKEKKEEVTVGSQTTKQPTGESVGTSTDDMISERKSSKTVQPTKMKEEPTRRVTRQMAKMEKLQNEEQKAKGSKAAPSRTPTTTSRITTRRQARRMSENAGVVRMNDMSVNNLTAATMPASGVSANRRGKTKSDKGTNTPRPTKRKPNMCDQATSTSDPVKEEDPVQTLKLTARTLETVTLHWCGISHLEIEGCMRMKNLQITACRIFKDLKLDRCPDLRNIKLTQCRRLHNDAILRAVLKLPPRASRFVHLRPMYRFDRISMERMLFSDLIPHNYNICLVFDHSYPPQIETTVYMKNWLQIMSDISFDLMDCFKMPNALRIPRPSKKYPWNRNIHRFSFKYKESPLEIVTDSPYLHLLTGNEDFPLGEPFKPVANGKEMRDITFLNVERCMEALYCNFLELSETRTSVFKDTVMVYIQLCDIDGEPCEDPYA
ncbi:F-box only protein 38-like [Ptychodera flava]|uniref:F-box only protein 38-like n=1 Tax=Ptychodera flava TaxID=63121 RepID=UPI00396A86C3